MNRLIESSVNRAMFCVVAVLALLGAITVDAADKYWKGGSGNWDTTTANWGLSSGGPYDQVWADGDDAYIDAGSGGTITNTEDINIANLYILTNDYTITSNTLAFSASGVVSNIGDRLVLECGISGRPDVYMLHDLATSDRCHFAPIEDPILIGTLYRHKDNYLRYNGSATGNSITEIADLTGSWIGNGRNNKNDMYGTADWSVGDAWFGSMTLYGGTLVVTGEVWMQWQDLEVRSGSSIHLNHAGAIMQSGRLELLGGDLDNSSGSNITGSVYNPTYDLMGDTAFIGSSDLNMGTGAATMSTDVTMTVSNAAATLTIAGGVGSSGYAYDLTKDGPGTLELTGTNTYLGETVVSDGTLSITQTNSLSDLSFVRIAGGAVLNLNHSGTDKVLGVYTNGVQGPIGTWGALGSGADNETALITGSGILNAPAPTAVDGIRWWDGGTTNIAAVGNQLSDGDGGIWSTSVTNWDMGAGVSHTNWNNATNDIAFFRGGGGTVTLAEDITLGHLRLDSRHYVLSGNTLHFTPGGTVSNTGTAVQNADGNTIACGITGSPDVWVSRGSNEKFRLAPTNASMTLGTINFAGDQYLRLEGTATNTVAEILKGINNQKVHKFGSGTWTVNGELYGGQTWIYEGTLICNGKLWETYQGVRLYGGTLIANGLVDGNISYNTGGGYNGDGTLAGTGVCDSAISVPTNGVIAPGYPTGTLTASNAVTINGTLKIEIDGSRSPKYSTLDVDSTLDISAATSTLDISETNPVYGDLVIATYDSLVGSAFAVTNGLPENATIAYGATAITLTVPNPAGTLFIFE